jgi:hypothetical protein
MMQQSNTTIYKRYGLWYVTFAEGTNVAPIHVTGPFQTESEAKQIAHLGVFAQRLVH